MSADALWPAALPHVAILRKTTSSLAEEFHSSDFVYDKGFAPRDLDWWVIVVGDLVCGHASGAILSDKCVYVMAVGHSS